MKISKELKKYFQKRVQKIDFLLEQTENSYAPEYFHQLRLEIKKMKALFKFISFYSKKFDFDEAFKPYKTIFNQAGKVRELQLEEGMFKKDKKVDFLIKYRRNLKELKLKEQIRFCQTINRKLLNVLKNSDKATLPLFKKVKKNIMQIYANENWMKIRKLACKQNLTTNEIHKLRKKLKSLYYIQKIGGIKSLKKELKGMEYLMEIIGEWHDRLVMKEHLQKPIRSAGLKTVELRSLNRMRTVLDEERKLFLQKITKELRTKCLS